LANRWYQKASVQGALVGGVFLTIITAIVEFSPKRRLEKQVSDLKAQLAPFKTLALERFGGNEQQALVKLATQLGELQTQLERQAGTIGRLEVKAVATLTGDWKSQTPPDFSKSSRTGSRGFDIRAELKTKDADMRWVEFTNTTPPRMVAGEHNTWILDYGVEAPAGSWVLGANRNDLETCGTVQMWLYGIDYNTTQDGVVTISSVTLTFYVNGIPAYRCEYHTSSSRQLLPEDGSPVKVQLAGPAKIQPIP
jgi:hypothetical protein